MGTLRSGLARQAGAAAQRGLVRPRNLSKKTSQATRLCQTWQDRYGFRPFGQAGSPRSSQPRVILGAPAPPRYPRALMSPRICSQPRHKGLYVLGRQRPTEHADLESGRRMVGDPGSILAQLSFRSDSDSLGTGTTPGWGCPETSLFIPVSGSLLVNTGPLAPLSWATHTSRQALISPRKCHRCCHRFLDPDPVAPPMPPTPYMSL